MTMHALDKFDPELGFRFSTYATWRIRQNIERAIMNQARTIRLPVHVLKEFHHIWWMMHALDDLGNKTGLETVAEKAGMTPEEVQWVILQNEKMLSIDASLEIDPMLTIGDAFPMTNILHPISRRKIRNWKYCLPNGWEHWKANSGLSLSADTDFTIRTWTLQELADTLDLSRECIRQIQREALLELRDMLYRSSI